MSDPVLSVRIPGVNMFRVIIHVYNTYCTHGYIVIHIDTRSFYVPSDRNLLDIGENCNPFVVFQFYHSPSFLVTNSALLTVLVLKVKEGWLCNFGVKELTASSLVGIFLTHLNQRIKRTFLITCCLAGIYLSIFQRILLLLQNHKALLCFAQSILDEWDSIAFRLVDIMYALIIMQNYYYRYFDIMHLWM